MAERAPLGPPEGSCFNIVRNFLKKWKATLVVSESDLYNPQIDARSLSQAYSLIADSSALFADTFHLWHGIVADWCGIVPSSRERSFKMRQKALEGHLHLRWCSLGHESENSLKTLMIQWIFTKLHSFCKRSRKKFSSPSENLDFIDTFAMILAKTQCWTQPTITWLKHHTTDLSQHHSVVTLWLSRSNTDDAMLRF